MSTGLKCTKCERPTQDSYLCRRCGIALRNLLIGSRRHQSACTELGEMRAAARGDQPGIIWYVQRLRETAYRQSRLDTTSVRRGNDGYVLLPNKQAIDLLARISITLDSWGAALDRLTVPHIDQDDGSGVILWARGYEGLDAWRAAYLAHHVPILRRRCPDIASLLNDLSIYAKSAWKIINRPNDNCCGPCPALDRDETACGTILYAEDHDEQVECPKCHALHDVATLREGLREATVDMLFTATELMGLMKTRLNDQISKTAFYQLVRDGRLRPRAYNGLGHPMFTYGDVCIARDTVKPSARQRKSRGA